MQSPKEGEILLHQIVENWQRLDMHPFDLADALSRLRDANGYTQQDLARETGKSKGEISKLLSLLDLNPDVQKVARNDETGRISRRHLYAVRDLPPPEQLTIIQQIEALVAKKKESVAGRKRRGAPVSHHRFMTSQAIVSVTFRKRDVSTDDILAALDEARGQVKP